MLQYGQLPVTQNWAWEWHHILWLADVQHWFGQYIDPSSLRKIILAEGIVFFTDSQFMSHYFQDREYEMLSSISQYTLTCNLVSLGLPLHQHKGTNDLCRDYINTQEMLLPFSLFFCLKLLDLDGPLLHFFFACVVLSCKTKKYVCQNLPSILSALLRYRSPERLC